MWSRRWTKYVTGLVMVVMVVPGMVLMAGATGRQPGSDAQDAATRERACVSLVDRLVAALGAITGQFDGLSVLGTERIPPMPSMERLRAEAVAFDERLAQTDCRRADARTAVEQWSRAGGASGPLAESVRAALAANVVDVVSGGAGPVRRDVRAGEDLADVLSRLPSGATVVLPEGRFALDRTVAFVQDVTIRGAGRGRTVITTRAQGAGMVLASQVGLRLSGVRIEHRGGGTASILLLRAGTAVLRDVHVTGAPRRAPVGRGSQGVLAGGSGIVVAGGEALSLRAFTSSRNAVAGLLVATGEPRVRASSFRGNGVCGVCYIGRSAGRVVDSVVVGNGAGVMFGERSAPVVEDNRIEQNKQAGLVLEGAAHPRVRRNTVRGNGGIGVAVYGTASPRLSGNAVTGHRQAGVLVDVGARATPRLLDNQLRDNGSAGLVFMGRSGGSASGNACSGSRFGLVLDGSAAPVLDTNDCAVQDQRDGGASR